MIRTAEQLRQRLSLGETVSLQAKFEEAGFRLASTATSETCFRSALNKLVASGDAVPVSRDMAGEPYEWGRA